MVSDVDDDLLLVSDDAPMSFVQIQDGTNRGSRRGENAEMTDLAEEEL